MAKAPRKQLSELDDIALIRHFKQVFIEDRDHSRAWRQAASDAYDFVAGHGQWTSDERSFYKDSRRVPITFNRTLTIIEAVAGLEINSRHDTVFMPHGTAPGAALRSELLSSASRWMSYEGNADAAQSRAFQDCVITGMGWTEQFLSYDEELDGSYREKRISPLEMYWDKKAREPNLSDARRIWHVRADVDIEDAREMFPDATDEDLDATWANESKSGNDKSAEDKRRRDENSDGIESQSVTLVRVQWWEYANVYRVVGQGGQFQELTEEQFTTASERAAQLGQPLQGIKQRKRMYMQAFLGDVVLKKGPAPCPHGFSFNSITGKPDEKSGTWYGLVSVIHDPQKMANVWLTQTLHILNATAKGGIVAEEDAFADQRDAEENYAKPDAITWVTKGAIQNGKLMPKPGAGMPQGHMQLLEFAISSIRDASGVNMELLGLRDANQPGVLEAQRKQAGMTILATMFDSLREFRARVGKGRLYFIQEYLADGRLIRSSGERGQEYVQLAKDKVAGRYEIIVEDAPTSPNQKAETWALMQPILAAYRDSITPEVLIELLEFSPLPASVVEKLRKVASAPDEGKQKQQQLGERAAVAKIAVDEATANEKQVNARVKQIEAGVAVADAEHERLQMQNGLAATSQPRSPLPADAF